jgi:hypothetical protein
VMALRMAGKPVMRAILGSKFRRGVANVEDPADVRC